MISWVEQVNDFKTQEYQYCSVYPPPLPHQQNHTHTHTHTPLITARVEFSIRVSTPMGHSTHTHTHTHIHTYTHSPLMIRVRTPMGQSTHRSHCIHQYSITIYNSAFAAAPFSGSEVQNPEWAHRTQPLYFWQSASSWQGGPCLSGTQWSPEGEGGGEGEGRCGGFLLPQTRGKSAIAARDHRPLSEFRHADRDSWSCLSLLKISMLAFSIARCASAKLLSPAAVHASSMSFSGGALNRQTCSK